MKELAKIQRRINSTLNEFPVDTLREMLDEWHKYGSKGYGQLMRRHFTRGLTGGYWSQAIDSMVGIGIGQRLSGEKVKVV